MAKCCLGMVVLFAAASVAHAQTYPTKSLRIIASQSAGGGVDTVSRWVAARLTETLGQQVIVDNRPGANGSLAAEMTAKSPPDGYTLMLGAAGNLGVNRYFIKQMNYDPFTELAHVTPAITSGSVLVAHPLLPVKSLKDLLALARARPDTLTHGSSGVGGIGHLAGVPGFEASSWYGFVVAAKTPQPIIARLHKEIVQVLNRPESAETLLKSGLEVWTSTPEFFAGYVKSEYEKWGRIIQELGITAN